MKTGKFWFLVVNENKKKNILVFSCLAHHCPRKSGRKWEVDNDRERFGHTTCTHEGTKNRTANGGNVKRRHENVSLKQ